MSGMSNKGKIFKVQFPFNEVIHTNHPPTVRIIRFNS